jgi:Fungal cellulose binding domain
VLPCKSGAPDQVFGGPNGKMAYKIPNVDIPDAVVIAYWLTQNTCNSPDGFMDDYKYPSVWAGCPGDGGVMGGHPKFKDCTTTGQIPEEFFSCGDVQITGGSGGSSPAPRKVSPVAGTDAPKTSGAESAKATPEATPNAAGGKGNATSYAYNGGKTKMTAETATTPPPVTSVECNKQAPALLQPTNSEETCSGHWRQCGGKGWDGTTKCCDDKYTCVSVNDFYSQCLTQA